MFTLTGYHVGKFNGQNGISEFQKNRTLFENSIKIFSPSMLIRDSLITFVTLVIKKMLRCCLIFVNIFISCVI